MLNYFKLVKPYSHLKKPHDPNVFTYKFFIIHKDLTPILRSYESFRENHFVIELNNCFSLEGLQSLRDGIGILTWFYKIL